MSKNIGQDTHNIVHAEEVKEILKEELMSALADPTMAAKLPPVMLWGPAGVGKSTIVKSVALEMGLDFVDIRLAEMESVDIRGVPKPNDKTKKTEWFCSDLFPEDNTKGGIIFLDELSACPKDTQVAAYEIVLDRQLGGGKLYKVPSKWIIVAAGNRTCDRAVATTMSSALANRMMHLEMEANVDDWVQWAIRADVHPAVIAWMKFKPDTICVTEDQNMERGFPTPRSWERVSEMLKLIKNPNLLAKAVKGLIGMSVGQTFMTFYKDYEGMADVLEMMTNPKAKVVIPTRDDLKWSMTTAMVYHLWRGKDAADAKARLDGYFRIAMNLPPAFAMTANKAAQQGYGNISVREATMTMMRHPSYKEWRMKFKSFLNEDYEV